MIDGQDLRRDAGECPPEIIEAVARALERRDYGADRLRAVVTGYAQRARAAGRTRDHTIAVLRRCVIAAVPVAFLIDEAGELWLNLLHWVFGVYHIAE